MHWPLPRRLVAVRCAADVADANQPAPSGGFFYGAIAMETTTAVCRQCNKRFPLSRRSNQHHRASGSPHQATRFCGPACKQAAWRKRNAERPKSVEGTNTHATVTAQEISQSFQVAAGGIS